MSEELQAATHRSFLRNTSRVGNGNSNTEPGVLVDLNGPNQQRRLSLPLTRPSRSTLTEVDPEPSALGPMALVRRCEQAGDLVARKSIRAANP